jgi:hypothetical protein
MPLALADIKRIESKLDLIIDAFGLSEKHKMSEIEVKQLTDNIVLNFEERRRKANGHGSQKNP